MTMPDQLPLFDQNNPPNKKYVPPVQVLEPIPLDKDRAASPAELVPPKAKFRFTNNYNISGALTGRLLRALSEGISIGLTQDELASKLTIPTERLKSIYNFVQKAEMVTAKDKLTPFGTLVLSFDPHLLDPGFNWFLHYLVSSNAYVIIWSRLFDHVLYQTDNISPADIVTYYSDAKGKMKDGVFAHNGAKELGSILRTYADDLFKPLGLVIRVDLGKYLVLTDEFPIPSLIWLASILAYRDRYYPKAASLETHLLVDAHFSPGRLFRQNEAAVRRALDVLHNAGLLTIESRLGLDQVRFKREHTWLSALADYLQERR
jgi:hypothetical protein